MCLLSSPEVKLKNGLICIIHQIHLMNNKMMQGMLLELWMVTVFRDDGVIVGSLELGLSQHQPCMPRVVR